jgi:mannose-6-phosphate isomerase
MSARVIPTADDPRATLARCREQLLRWLIECAYPRWAAHGIDASGGFVEALAQDGTSLARPRRARVHPRQVYAFALAPRFGWHRDVPVIIERGWHWFEQRYRRTDGLYRAVVADDGTPVEERALLYDQAFALLGLEGCARVLGSARGFEARALELRALIEERFATGDGAFRPSKDATHLESNPHMHLLEACLAWSQAGEDPGWSHWVRRLVSVALERFRRAGTGAIGERFDLDGRAICDLGEGLIEPGHQFEWAWLLMRSRTLHAGPLLATAEHLCALAEQRGLRNGLVVNALHDDLSVHDANARLWPQTERLKAALLLARLTQDPLHEAHAAEAASSLLRYLATPVPGLWFDVCLPSGTVLHAPATASTLYHLVGALAELKLTSSQHEPGATPRPT